MTVWVVEVEEEHEPGMYSWVLESVHAKAPSAYDKMQVLAHRDASQHPVYILKHALERVRVREVEVVEE